MTLYNYLKKEFMLSGSIQIDDTENSNPSNFGDFRYNSYYGIVLEDINKLKKEDVSRAWFFPQFMTFGDYDHSCHVERSNKRVFLEEYGHIQGIKEIYGGYGSEAVIIRLDTDMTEFIEVLESLESYPAIDDEDCIFLEMELLNEAWEDYGKDEVQDLISEKGLKVGPDEVRNKVSGQGYEMIEAGGTAYIDSEGMVNEYMKETK